MKTPLIALCGLLLFGFGRAAAFAEEARMKSGQVEMVVPVTMRHLFALPAGYDADKGKRWPLVIFLHGSGERGDDLKKVTKHGPPKQAEAGREFPFILVAPQCPAGSWWDLAVLDRWLDGVMREFRVDPDRVYLTGISMGGFGTWTWAQKSPERFAAIMPICGGGDPARAGVLKDIPTWAFHGAKDGTVVPAKSEEMIAGMRAAGAEPKLTIYPEAAHDSWTPTYDNDEVYAWLLAQKRVTPAQAKP